MKIFKEETKEGISMDLTALFKLSYGLYIITSKKENKLNGQIANTAFQVTAEPPQIAISINKENLTHEYIKESKVFAVSILSVNAPMELIGKFGFKSGRDIDKFEGINFKIGKTGSPIVLDNAIAFVEAKVVKELDVGTHTIFIGEIVNADNLASGEPMTYAIYHLVKKGKSPKKAPVYIPEEKEEKSMIEEKKEKYVCTVCGYIYDPEKGDPANGIDPGTPFEEIPDDWVCPICGAPKEAFEKA